MRQRAGRVYEFGSYRLMYDDRLLLNLHSGRRVPLTAKGFDILTVLLDRAGHLVTKPEFQRRVWPEVFVTQGTLHQHIYALRRALDAGREEPSYIETVDKFGYRLAVPVKVMRTGWPAEAARPSSRERRVRSRRTDSGKKLFEPVSRFRGQANAMSVYEPLRANDRVAEQPPSASEETQTTERIDEPAFAR